MIIEHACRLNQMVPDGGEREIDSTLSYDTTDPYAFTWTFYPPEDPDGVEWTMSREQLRAGTISPVQIGPGDVRFAACIFGELIHVELDDPEGVRVVILHAPYAEVIHFLADTAKEVPFGEESAKCDLDKLVGQLLGEG